MEAMADGRWHGLGALAAATGLAKATAFNLVNALAQTGLAEHDAAQGAYRLGLRLLEYGHAVSRRMDLPERLRPVLMSLCAESNETVNLAVPRALDVLIVESLEGRQSVRVTAYAGTRAAYHCTALGRAMLAYMPVAQRAALLGRALPAASARTVTDAAALGAVLDQVVRDGFAWEREENELGACCVAAPVLGPRGSVLGAVSIAGPVGRMDAGVVDRLGRLLRQRLGRVSFPVETGLRRA